ncbi:hypothetical protein MBLNU457_5358t1 [Dothideomycetes sp. NU457]
MSAILSAEDLNDFISPGVACIKPIETLPKQQPDQNANPYEVTTEDKVAAANAPPASISLTDCLACSGCVTSAEAVLVSLQSHAEVLNTLDAYPELPLPWATTNGMDEGYGGEADGKIFVASVSPQSRASIAATYGVSEREAGHMIAQLLSGPKGLRSGGNHQSGFTWIIDTNVMRQAALVAAADEVMDAINPTRSIAGDIKGSKAHKPKRPVLSSACPGWICYAEKTHPHVLPYISRVKSPQALTGTLIKSFLAKRYNIRPDQIWHMAVMPCFDKKLEASRAELTDTHWTSASDTVPNPGIRDVDCVITARELLMLADARNISFPSLPRKPLPRSQLPPFPDPTLNAFLFPRRRTQNGTPDAGTSGGYLQHVLRTYQVRNPGSSIRVTQGRNADVVEYVLLSSNDEPLLRCARYYGFRNIQNLVRRLKPAKQSRMPGVARRAGAAAAAAQGTGMGDYAYVEVMACPGGCTNGGGQIKVGDVGALRGSGVENGGEQVVGAEQKVWLRGVDEAYFSASGGEDEEEEKDGDDVMDVDESEDVVDGIDRKHVKHVLEHWAQMTGLDLDKLVCTSYRKVESDVGKGNDMERVAGLAASMGGGW